MIGLATGALVTAIWQGLLLAAAVGLGLRLAPKIPAGVRFAIWFAVFGVVVALPLISLWPHSAVEASGHGRWLTLDERWSVAIAAVWIAASLVRAATLVAAGLRVRALWKRATPVEIALPGGCGETAMVEGSGVETANGRRAQVCVSDEVDRPTVIGFFAPKILIPNWLMEKLTPAELEQVLLHESGHLGRADDWMNLLQKMALVVFPLNPALAWVERRLCFERELAVDERVLQAMEGRPGGAKAYASCLATLAEHRLGRRGLALALGVLGRESELGRRIGRILRRPERMRPLQAKLVLGGAMVGLLGISAGLERCPQMIGFGVTGTESARMESPATPLVLPNGYSYKAVVYRPKTLVSQRLLTKTDVAHEVLLKVQPMPGAAVAKAVASQDEIAEGRQATMVAKAIETRATVTKVGSAAQGAKMVPLLARQGQQPVQQQSSRADAAPVRRGTVLVGWVVVTAWQSADGSRVVMATETQMPAAQPEGAASGGTANGQQVHYGALAVRDGWLVFQL